MQDAHAQATTSTPRTLMLSPNIISLGTPTSPTTPRDEADDEVSSVAASNAPPSPSFAEFMQTTATLDELARQLGGSVYEDEAEAQVQCCCGKAGGSCNMGRAKEKLEEKLKLSGEVGNALLARYEALERRCQRQVDKYEEQLRVKRAALADSVKRVHNLEKANATHMQKYAEMTRKNEALDKRYTQALHTQTLTQQSLTHVRGELTDLRNRMKRQSMAIASGAGFEERLDEVEKRYEEAKEAAESETRKLRDELRRRTRLEARIEELEAQLALRTREVEEVTDARSKDAQELLSNAKERLSVLHEELSETFRTDDPSSMPEYQRTLEDLVASNTLLKHDTTELARQLTDVTEENRALKEEIDELRSVVGVARRSSPDPTTRPGPLAAEISATMSHSRTESSPNFGNFDRSAWARRSVQIPSSSRILLEHGRRPSMTNSVTSSTTAAEISGLGMGPVGEYGGPLLREEKDLASLSPPIEDGRQSPKPVLRSSPSGGIGYVVNGVPKGRPSGIRNPLNRSISLDRRRLSLRNYSPKGVDVIAEWGPIEGDSSSNRADASMSTSTSTEEPLSPGQEYFKAADMARRRRSMLSRADTNSTRGSFDTSPNISQTLVDQSMSGDLPSPMSESSLPTPGGEKRVHRRTLLLLTRSQGTQTDPPEEVAARREQMVSRGTATPSVVVDSVAMSLDGSPNVTNKANSDTSSIMDTRMATGVMALLIEYLTKTLVKIQSTDIPTLNRRLKRQHLPGDVRHLSKSSLQSIQQEIMDLRQAFRGVHDLSNVTRKEFSSLLKFMKDVFLQLTQLQAVINDVTIEPALAKKLHRAAYAVEGEDAKDAKQASGLGWIAAPITKLFVTPASENDPDTSPAISDGSRGLTADAHKHNTGTLRAPKLQASTSSTTTHVSVEFGGAGIVRRATPAPSGGRPSAAVTNNLPASPDPSTSFAVDHGTLRDRGQQQQRAVSDHLDPNSETGTSRTLKPSKSRANRNELLGIFAGATRPISPTPWVVLPGQGHHDPPRASGSGLGSGSGAGSGSGSRTTSARHRIDRSLNQSVDAQSSTKRLSTAVDAVIDSRSDLKDAFEDSIIDRPLMEKTLRRKKGLSDSSIRSTFVSHDKGSEAYFDDHDHNPPMATEVVVPPSQGGTIPSRMGGYPKEATKGYFEGWTSRLYGFRATPAATPAAVPATQQSPLGSTDHTPGAVVEPVRSTSPAPASSASLKSIDQTGETSGTSPKAGSSPPVAIKTTSSTIKSRAARPSIGPADSSRSIASSSGVTPDSLAASQSKPGGLLGYIAESLTAAGASLAEGMEGEVGVEAEDEYRDARHRSGAAKVGVGMMGPGARSVSGRGAWS